MPLFLPPPVAPIALYSDDIASATSAGGITAGAVYISSYVIYTQLTIAQMRCCFSGVPTGNVDMGIYDINFNLLGHTGAIAAATGMFTQNLTSNLVLSPGQYWFAFLDTVADTVYRAQASAAISGMIPAQRTTSTILTVLPSTLGAVTDNINRIAIMALRSGGFS